MRNLTHVWRGDSEEKLFNEAQQKCPNVWFWELTVWSGRVDLEWFYNAESYCIITRLNRVSKITAKDLVCFVYSVVTWFYPESICIFHISKFNTRHWSCKIVGSNWHRWVTITKSETLICCKYFCSAINSSPLIAPLCCLKKCSLIP